MSKHQKALNEGITTKDSTLAGSAVEDAATAPTAPGDHPQPTAGRSNEQWPIDDIKPHAMNATLYGDTCDRALIESIKEHGILDPLVILPDGTLLGGHRRLAAAHQLEMTTVPVHIMPVSDERDPVGVIIGLNVNRPKTPTMKVREYAALIEIEARKAKGRQGRRNILPDLAGSAREIAALKVGLKHATAEKGLKVIAVIDKHTGAADARALLDLMNCRSVDAAFKQGQALGWIKQMPRKPRAGGKPQSSPKAELQTKPNNERPLITEPEAPPANVDQPLEGVTPPASPVGDTQPGSQGAECMVPDVPPAEGLTHDAAQTPDSGAVNEAPTTDAQVITTAKAKSQKHLAEQFPFNFAEDPGLIVDGWCDGVIDQQRVREVVASFAENLKGDSPQNVTETQRFTVQLATFVNSIVPANATAATLRNLLDAAEWMSKTIDAISRTRIRR